MDKTEFLAKLMAEGRMFSARNEFSGSIKQSEPVQEFKEDGKRQEVAKLAETTSIPESSTSIQKSHATLQAFKSLKDHVFSNPNLDSETIVNFNQIESYLNSLVTKYSDSLKK